MCAFIILDIKTLFLSSPCYALIVSLLFCPYVFIVLLCYNIHVLIIRIILSQCNDSLFVSHCISFVFVSFIVISISLHCSYMYITYHSYYLWCANYSVCGFAFPVYVMSEGVNAEVTFGNITVANGVLHVVDSILGFKYNSALQQVEMDSTLRWVVLYSYTKSDGNLTILVIF